MTDVLARILEHRVIAILRRVPPKHVVRTVETLRTAGVGIVEITLDSESALEQIALVRKTADELLVVAGTVRTVADVDAAVHAGADVCTSPVRRADVVERCVELGVAAMPGALTPTEIAVAWQLGARIVKLFPARAVGPEYVRDLAGPLPHIPIVATGSIDETSAVAFLQAGAIGVGIGSSLVSAERTTRGDWSGIARDAAALVAAARSA